MTDDSLTDYYVLAAMQDVAVRSYYIFQLLEESVYRQRESFLNLVATFLGSMAAVVSVFSLFQVPGQWPLVATVLVAALSLIVIGVLLARKAARKEGLLRRETIFLQVIDEATKCTNRIRLLDAYSGAHPELASLLRDETARSLGASIIDIKAWGSRLEAAGKFAEALETIGRDRAWYDGFLKQVDILLSRPTR